MRHSIDIGVKTGYYINIMKSEDLIYIEKPTLNNPYLIIGFEGWPNAAEVSSFSIHHLIEKLDAKRFAYISHENFYNFCSTRPSGIIKQGRIIEIKFPQNNFYYSKNKLSKDIILFQGTEPHLRWKSFVESILNLAQNFCVSEIITIGGTYDYIPHTFPTKVSAVFNDNDLKEKIQRAGIGLTEYSGPISIHTFILEGARLKGIKAMSLWGHAPQYLQAKNLKVAFEVLKKLCNLIEEEIDLYNLQLASQYFDQQINQLIEKDPKIREVIERLEDTYKEEEKDFASSKKQEVSKDDKVIYIQAFLKRQDEEEKGE